MRDLGHWRSRNKYPTVGRGALTIWSHRSVSGRYTLKYSYESMRWVKKRHEYWPCVYIVLDIAEGGIVFSGERDDESPTSLFQLIGLLAQIEDWRNPK